MMGDHRLIVNTLLFSPLTPRPASSVTNHQFDHYHHYHYCCKSVNNKILEFD